MVTKGAFLYQSRAVFFESVDLQVISLSVAVTQVYDFPEFNTNDTMQSCIYSINI